MAAVVDDVEAPSPISSRMGNEATHKDIIWGNVCFSAGPKTILKNCWGEVKSGELCALMGASGAGKSSMLNVLAGRVISKGNLDVTGFVSVGGKQINPVAYRQRIAYVMQDDVLLETATPREILTFSANLRLPETVTDEERKSRVDRLLKELGVESSADTNVGGAMFKGISGGERKRVCVGVELIAKPEVLFLDEPTSGLDSFSAFNLVKTLKTVASGGSAVLCTIHQPSSEVFFQFDKVVLMKAGEIMYQGSTSALVDTFAACGFQCPPTHNPSDFVMFVSQTNEVPALKTAGFFPEAPGNVKAGMTASSQALVFDSSSVPKVEKHGFFRQLKLIFQRELQETVRDKPALIARYGITLFLSLLFGIIFKNAGQRDDREQDNISTHQGSVTFLGINAMFMFANPVLLSFPVARNLFMREFSTGTYDTIPYFLSKTAVELLLSFLQANFKVALLLAFIRFQGNYIVLVFAVFLTGIASASAAVTLSCVVKDIRSASEMMPLVFVPQILYAGFFVRMDQIPVWLRWPQYLCALKYGLNLLLDEEFDQNCRPGAEANCERLLESNNVEHHLWWLYAGVLIALTVVFRSLGAALLARKAMREV